MTNSVCVIFASFQPEVQSFGALAQSTNSPLVRILTSDFKSLRLRARHAFGTFGEYRTRQVQAAENRHGIDSAELKAVRDEQNELVFASYKQDRTEWHDAIVQRLLEHAKAGEQRAATHLLHRLHRQKRKRKRRAQPQKDCYTQQELGSLQEQMMYV